MKRTIALSLIALLFIGAGILHFLVTSFFVGIVPPYLPAPHLLVYISGICEILGGLGVLLPALRRWAGWGLIALLVAVFPANIQMFVDSLKGLSPSFVTWAAALLLFLRLPLQFVLIMWVYHTTLKNVNKKEPAVSGAN